MRISRTSAPTAVAPIKRVTGAVWVDEIAAPDSASRLRVDSVRFAPGARTVWHRHPFGQVLLVTDGAGLVQCRGGPVEVIRTGDSVRIGPTEWHWHGATPDTF